MTLRHRFTVFARLGFVAAVVFAVTTGCSPLASPFSGMKDSQMTVYRLQNFEPPPQPAQAAAPAGLQLPAQIQQWIQAGASLLPPGLLPPGLVPGSAPPAPAPDAPRFHGFRILAWQAVNDPGTKGDVLDAFGHSSNFTDARSNCLFAELGFAIAQPSNPTPADVLVSLSCEQLQSFNFAWPYSQTGLTPDTAKKFASIAQRVFAGQ